LLDELTKEYNLQLDQAEALIKGMVTNGILKPKKIGPALFYQGTKAE